MTTASTTQATEEPKDESTESPTPLDADERFHLLRNERRRLVIQYLRETESDAEDGQLEMRDIAEQVAAWEHDTTVAQLSSTERRRVYIPLYQDHLPKLDDAGVIDYNQDRGRVVPTERVNQLAKFLSIPATGKDATNVTDDAGGSVAAWNKYYLSASGVGALMLGGVALSLLPAFFVTVVILVLFSTMSVWQYWSQIRPLTSSGERV